VIECGDCGYRLPEIFDLCPLCGGVAGKELYFKRRAARAHFN
jgi:hypothetical protein